MIFLNNIVNKLEWDSNFFHIRIGKIIALSQAEIDELFSRKEELASLYDLIYVFSETILNTSIMKNCFLADQKVVYKMTVSSIADQLDDNIVEYKDQKVSSDLLNLALQSGEYSRFKLDKKLPANSYERFPIVTTRSS